MEMSGGDHSTDTQKASVDAQESHDAADLKAQLVAAGLAVSNNIDHQNHTNGLINNNIDGKPREHSSSKSHSSSSSKHKDHHSSSSHKDGSSKHKENGHKSSSDHKHREQSSSSKDKSSSSSSKHRDEHRHKEGSSSSKDKHSSSGDKHRDSSSKDKHSSSGSTKDKHSSSSGDKHRDKDKHNSSSSKLSSSSSGDKHKSSSSSGDKHSSDKHKSSSSSSSSKDRHKESSSSSDKHKSSSSSSSKHRDSSHSDKHKDSSKHKERPKDDKPRESSSSGDKHKESSHSDKHREKPKSTDENANVKKEPGSPTKVKHEPASPVKVVKKEALSDDEDDAPLSMRLQETKVKQEKAPKRYAEDSEDDEPLAGRAEKAKKIKVEEKSAKKRKAEDDDFSPPAKKSKPKDKKKVKQETAKTPTKGRAKPKKEKVVEGAETWKWWEEEKKADGVKWSYLEHKGPVFAPDYEKLPDGVIFRYNGKEMKLSPDVEEVAGFFAKMLEHDYTTRDVFRKNFYKNWRQVMTKEEKEILTDLNKCDFKSMHAFFTQQSEDRKNRTKEEKKALKEANEAVNKEYGFCTMDGHKEKIGNFKIEPPGLFRGRGEHPKQGMLKKRVVPEQVIINASANSNIPEPPPGHQWKKVQHDNTVSWLASWTENVQGQVKYVMLNAASRLKGEKDWNKYEVARKLNKCADKIRAQYRQDWKHKEMRVRQRAVALYFIDKLALRAGNEKEEGETADTVGCCSLRVEHIKLNEKMDDKEFVVEFDFLGKDSIRYYNAVPVEKRVFRNLQLFTENKQPEDDLFDRLNTGILNKHLHDLMDGLTAKVFRTYNASKTLTEQLDLLTVSDDPVSAKMLSYNRANRAVAILCNHQRAVPKNFSKQMENLQTQIDAKIKLVKDAKKALKGAKVDFKNHKTEKNKKEFDKRKKAVQRLEEQLNKLEIKATDKDENKEIALGTSKLNYLDPRISVAWCKKWEVPIEKIYNKTQRDKFRWAIDMAGPEFRFTDDPEKDVQNRSMADDDDEEDMDEGDD